MRHRMPGDVDKRPPKVHFAGRFVLRFYVAYSVKPILTLNFDTEAQARGFRRGFKRAAGKDLQKFAFAEYWIDAGAAFWTPWRFFARRWGFDSIPVLVLSSLDA
jgi:hypothetical protein